MREAAKQSGRNGQLPWPTLSALTSPRPSGERQEHLTAILDEGRPHTRRRMRRVLADLGFRWAVGALPRECRWLLDTQAMFLKKQRFRERATRRTTHGSGGWQMFQRTRWFNSNLPSSCNSHATQHSSNRRQQRKHRRRPAPSRWASSCESGLHDATSA